MSDNNLHFEIPDINVSLEYRGTDGEHYTFSADAIQAHDFLSSCYRKHGDNDEAIYQDMSNYVEEHGGKAAPETVISLVPYAINAAYDELKKKLDPKLISQLSTESTPSLLDQLQEQFSKSTFQESAPSDKSTPSMPEDESPPS